MSASPPRSTSRIALLSTDERFVVETPRRGLYGAGLGQLLGGLLVLVICAQWTGRTWVNEGRGTASVSFPFWLFGLGIVVSAIQAMLRHDRLDIHADTGWIRTYPVGRKKSLRVRTLTVRLDEVTRGEADGRGGTQVPVLVLDDGQRVLRLLEGFSEAEQRWVRMELNAWLAKRSARPTDQAL